MQRFFNKTSAFLPLARSGFKPTFSVSQMRWRQSPTISRWPRDLQSRSLMTQILSLFSTTQNRSEEEINKEEALLIPNQNEAISDKQAAEDLLKCITSDLQEIYMNQELKKTPLYKLLFKDGIHISELITLKPQGRLVKGSFRRDNTRERYCVFFPNTIFQQIFQICESLMASEKTLITAQQGLGKTYALALYVYLKRKQSNCRVFYIHNCQSFIDFSFPGFLQEIEVAFAEELKIQELKNAFENLKKVTYDSKAPIEEQKKEIVIFSSQLGSYLRKKELKVYIIVDQVNVFAKERNKIEGAIATKILDTFDNALGETRNVYVASKTDEERMDQSQERPEKELIPPLQPEESLKAYIRFLVGGKTLKDETIQSIVNITGGVPLEARMFFQYLGSNQLNQKVLQDYKKKQIDLLRIKFNHFLNQDKRHFRNMVLAFEGLIRNGLYDFGMDRTKIDQRFLYVNVLQQKIYPLSPLVKEALKECYLQDPQTIDQIVQQFQNKPSVLGYLVEAEIQKLALSWLFSSDFIFPTASESNTTETGSLQINSSTEIANFEEEYNSNILEILEKNGYHTVHSNFPVFDGILVQDDKLVLVQIKRRPSKKVQEALNFLKQEIKNFITSDSGSFAFNNINRDPRAAGIVSKQEIIRFVLSNTIQKNKSLDIIFITSEGHLNDLYYKQITNQGKTLTIRFGELAVRTALKSASMSEKTRDVLSQTQE